MRVHRSASTGSSTSCEHDLEERFDEPETQLLIDALSHLRTTKQQALSMLKAEGVRPGGREFEPHDFGIPLIDSLLKRLCPEPFDRPSVAELQRHSEPLLAISIEHLRPQTREALASDALSIPAYPNEYGGFIHVGMTLPTEPELAAIFDAVRRIDVVWIKFDADADLVEGLPTFES